MGFVVKAIKSVVKVVVKIAKTVIMGGIGLILGMGRKKGNAKNKASDKRLSKQLDPEDFRKIVFGKTAMAVDLRYWEVHGTKFDRYAEVLAAAGHTVHSFGNLYLEDELVPFSGNNATGTYAGVLSRKTNNGAPGNAAIAMGSGSFWNTTSKFTGTAHYGLDWLVDDKKLPNGVPSRYTQEGEGALVYDPRRDSTRGGSGTHRANDQSTWEYAPLDSNGQPLGRNNALQMLWYLLGWKVTNPTTSEKTLVCGRGIDPNDINFADFIAAANTAEALDYYSDMILSTGDDHETNEAIISADGLFGEILDPGGMWTYRVTHDDTADVAVVLTDNDIVDGDVTWDPQAANDEIFNEIAGTYIDPSPASLYQTKAYPTVKDATYLASDGGRRKRESHNFQSVQDPALAQKLARIKLNRTRFTGEFQATFNLRAMKAQAWSIVTLSLERYGFVNKLFRVVSQSVTPMGIDMVLREEHPSIYAGGTVTIPAAPSALVKYDVRMAIPVENFNAVASSRTGAGGAAEDGVAMAWSAPPGNVRRTEAQYKRVGDVAWAVALTSVGDQLSCFIGPLLSSASYEVRVRHVSIHEVPGPWSTLTIATGANGRVTWAGVVGTGRPADNATVGAPNGTSVGGVPVETLINNINGVLDIGDDDKLTPVEKQTTIREYDNMVKDYNVVNTRRQALSITTEWNEFDTSVTALNSYLSGVSGGWANTTTTSTIDRGVWRAVWLAMYDKLYILKRKISEEDAKRATWATVDGTGKPADNAGTSGLLVPIGQFTVVRGNTVGKNGGIHGAYQGAAVGTPQVGSAYISGSIFDAMGGNGWITTLALDDNNSSFQGNGGTGTGNMNYEVVVTSIAPGGFCSMAFYENTVLKGNVTNIAITANSRFAVAYDGTKVIGIIDGVVHVSAPAAAGQTLWPKVLDFYVNGAGAITDILYGPYTENNWSSVGGIGKPADNATVGARAGTNLLDAAGSVLQDAAIKNSQQLWNEVQSKDLWLTDSRIPTGLDSNGRNQVGLRAGAGLPTVTNTDLLAGVTGTQLNQNPEFAGGSMAGWTGYNNGGGPSLSLSMEANQTAPNGSGHILVMSYNGTAGPNSPTLQPGYGGCTISLQHDGGVRRAGYYSKGTFIYHKIWVQIPAGRTMEWASNAIGNEASFEFLTPRVGTGNWQLIIARQYIGVTGTFSATGYLYIADGPNIAFSWYIAKWDIIDVTSSPRQFLGRGGLLDENGNTLFNGEVRNDNQRFDQIVADYGRPENNATVGARVGVNTRDQFGNLLSDQHLRNEQVTIDALGRFSNPVASSGNGTEITNSRLRVKSRTVNGRGYAQIFGNEGNTFVYEEELVPALQNADQLWSQVNGAEKPADYATSDLRLVAQGAGMTIVGNRAERTSSQGSWSAGVYSRESYIGGAFCSFSFLGQNEVMAGLNSDPLAELGYGKLDFSIYTPATFAASSAYESATNPFGFGAWTPDTVFSIVYDNEYVRYLKDGVEARAVYVGAGRKFHFDSSMVAGGVKNVRFGPYAAANAPLSFTHSSTHSSEGNTVFKRADGANDWDGKSISREFQQGTAFVSGRLDTAGTFLGMQLVGNTNVTFDAFAYSVHRSSNGTWAIYEDGGSPQNLGSGYTNDTQWTINYDGTSVRYYAGGVLVRELGASANKVLQAAAACVSAGARVSNIQFGPYTDRGWANISGVNKPQDNATVGAVAGTNLTDVNGNPIGHDAIRNNLALIDWWKEGAAIPWGLNSGSNGIYTYGRSGYGASVTGPMGYDDDCWYMQDSDGDPGGGWNGAPHVPLNQDKTYRFVIPVMHLSGAKTGVALWGPNDCCTLNTTTPDGNPYFVGLSQSNMITHRWYLLVGYIYPRNSTNKSHTSAGVWDTVTGLKVAGGTNFCFRSGQSVPMTRAYQYYANGVTEMLFGKPLIECFDGTQSGLREYFREGAMINTLQRFDEIVSGYGKPEANATRNESASNLVKTPVTYAGNAYANGAYLQDTGVANEPANRDSRRIYMPPGSEAYISPEGFSLVRDQTVFISFDFFCGGASAPLYARLILKNDVGTDVDYPVVVNVSPQSGQWLRASGSYKVPSTVSKAVLWFNAPAGTGAWYVANYYVGPSESGADVTLTSQVTTVAPEDVIINASSTGVIASTQFPKTFTPGVTRGGIAVRTDNRATYSATNLTPSITNLTIDNTAGSVNKGRVTLGNATASGTYQHNIFWDGVLIASYLVRATVVAAAAPVGGGGSGGTGNKSGSFSAVGFNVTGSATYIEMNRILNLTKSVGETIRCTFPYATYQYSSINGGSKFILGKWQYSPAGANSWTDFAAAVSGEFSSWYPQDFSGNEGNITVNQNAAPADGNYDIRLVVANNTGLGQGGNMEFSAGSASVLIGT